MGLGPLPEAHCRPVQPVESSPGARWRVHSHLTQPRANSAKFTQLPERQGPNFAQPQTRR